jgi:uncharacterized membrane protein (DUF441 family)
MTVKNFLTIIRENPRYLALFAGVVVQVLEKNGIIVPQEYVETALDLITALVVAQVLHKSKEGKLI